MKQLLTACLLFLALICSAQGIRKNVSTYSHAQYSEIDINTNKQQSNSTSDSNGRVTPEIFRKKAAANHIKSRTFKNINGADEGFYIVSGVFSDLGNAQNLAQKLKVKGFAAGYIGNPSNGLNYV
ncbi:unnamed protein product [Scytosiphon promiscuus]